MREFRGVMKRLLTGVLFVSGVVLVVILRFFLGLVLRILLVLLRPIFLILWIREKVLLRAFRKREAGRCYLICTSRRNWHDFLKNNVLPMLPEHYRVVWRKDKYSADAADIWDYLEPSGIHCVSKPYLVAVTGYALRYRSLNRDLQGLKACAKSSEATRQACAEIIRQAEDGLRRGGR